MNKVIDGLGVAFRVLLALFLFTAIQVAAIGLFRLFGLDTDVYKGLLSVSYGLAVIAAFLIYSAVRSYKRDQFIRLERQNPLNVFSAIVIGFGLLGLVVVYMYFAAKLSYIFESMQEDLAEYSERVDRFTAMDSKQVPYWDSLLDFVSSFLIIPLAEELTFRGVVFGELAGKMNHILAAFLSALIFGLFHGISVHIGYALICGFVLALTYYYSGSLIISFLIHSIFNLVGTSVFTLLDSGIFGDLSSFTYSSRFIMSVFEVICIIPGTAGFMLIYVLYNQKKEEAAS